MTKSGRGLSRFLVASLLALPAGWMAACQGGGGGDVVTEPIVVTVATAGGATSLAAGGRLGLTASVTHTNMDVTWSLSGASCPASCGTISPTGWGAAEYTAPAAVAATFTVSVTATSMDDTSKHDSVLLTVSPRACPPNAGMLEGQYAFLVQGFGPDAVAAVGSLTLDGCGVVTGGAADWFLGTYPAGSTISLAGTYAVGNQRRGTLTVLVPGFERTFAVALGGIAGGVASHGALTEFTASGNGQLSGELWKQDPDAFAVSRISGPYAFLLNGWTATGARRGIGGTVEADGSGHLGLGFLDAAGTGRSPISGTWDGTVGAPSPAGRAAVSAPNLTLYGTAIVYVVTADHLLMMIEDALDGALVSGSFLAQKGTFGQGSLSGNGAAWQTANYTQPGYASLTTSTLTLFTADGAGNLALTSVDQNDGGNLYTPAGIAYTYTVSANGHATIWTSPGVSGGKWYLTGPNTGLLLGFDPGMSVGAVAPQSAGPFSGASLDGTWFVRQAPGASPASTCASGVASSPGNGTISMTMDVNAAGSLSPGVASAPVFTVGGNGRATESNGLVIYVASPDRLFMMRMSTSDGASVVRILER